MTKVVLLTAGGTGGHLFPAQALAHVLIERGWVVHLATDGRATQYGHDFPAQSIQIIPSATPSVKNPVVMVKAALKLAKGYFAARNVIKDLKPDIVVGFGGYPTVPPMLAARTMGVPSCLHEQNGVMGRANRFLAKGASAIAASFPILKGAEGFDNKLTLTGNPVRPMVHEAAKTSFAPLTAEGEIRLVVFGGSQGARFFSEYMPGALGRLPQTMRDRIRLVQQCRTEDLLKVKVAYRELGMQADLAPFFADMPQKIADAHLVICRSGASSVSELAAIGRPSILVPLPGALDQDQKANASVLVDAGGAWVLEQRGLRPNDISDLIEDLIANPDKLSAAAEAARGQGKLDAANQLADLVEGLAKNSGVAK
ncbi:undecaprenyldiphospho-muramoylpentapeptide beta-N-acetylglucosaminyltransferase [Cohaesibacter celericrescens]|uniref:UDP-N-acetylglucosamine--N-acetylmuramyl-(pentapeptide) pyrophosphoryl-undecaprenol N-acetylglucosamine transferase n=1 Tax=Cohaesibacter celericrescens TaxID=2067669 RepID=A0A2N5XWS0_9HYPH|nr:undecaprenyldiphospho-muramoylpentapeptide beta-N-acetylglucosaminyltransferase [Cohaesibacter celericrescens]PLW75545.1 undecaprenyldiphospho-muramoylpentapeptide beta-N-acetylglucosaminyltransferase [Cohaesibacter celericrescens]PLW78952.1 undecaprenyldiphospho-muramoylpentapeptide beta-N-acetylglucosaminyltransferase [Cohaesibacter celericrescens]